jgi:hypothetical protein
MALWTTQLNDLMARWAGERARYNIITATIIHISIDNAGEPDTIMRKSVDDIRPSYFF